MANSNWNAKKVALTAVMASTLIVFKWALSAIANVELVTVLVSVYAYCFGFCSLIAVLVFSLVEMIYWGIGSWVVAYVIFWGIISIIFSLLGKSGYFNVWVFTVIIVLLTAFFGVLTSFCEIVLTGFSDFWSRFSIYYLRGVWFYVIHVVSNCVIMLLLFKPLVKVVQKLKTTYFPS